MEKRKCGQCNACGKKFPDEVGKTCCACLAYAKEYRAKNKGRRAAYNAANSARIKVARKRYVENNREKLAAYAKKYYAENKAKRLATCKRWRAENPERAKAIQAKSAAKPDAKLRRLLTSRLGKALGRNKASYATMDLLGCDLEFLKAHLESKFTDEMSWSNRGKGGWHVDHIVPLAAFDLNNVEAVQEACSWRNLQPLWELDNISKGCKMDYVPSGAIPT